MPGRDAGVLERYAEDVDALEQVLDPLLPAAADSDSDFSSVRANTPGVSCIVSMHGERNREPEA